MNHRPFDEWLLNDRILSPAEKRDLDAHLRSCRVCTALAETGLELRSARLVRPKPEFTARFQLRLAAHKMAERRRRLWGMLVLVLGGVGLLGWLAMPFLLAVASAPAEWITIAIGYFLFIVTSVQALTEVLQVLLRVAPAFVPAYFWMVLASVMAGLGLLWAISIWRFARLARGVTT